MSPKFVSVFCAALLLTACGSDPEKPAPTVEAPPPAPAAKTAEAPSEGGMFNWLGGSSGGDERKGVAVNAYLWRASLDTLSFMPMEQTDPFGGVIKTAWYDAPDAPNERLKVAVYILDSRLRADALRVSVFKEVKKPTGDWADGTVDPETVTKLENVILNRARALKIQSGG